MKKFTVLGGLMALALVIGMGASTFGAGKAEAKVKDVITFNPDVCFTLTGAVSPDVSDFQALVQDNFVPTGLGSGTIDPAVFADFYGSFNCYGATDVLARESPFPVLGYLVSWEFDTGTKDVNGKEIFITGDTFVDSWFAMNEIANLLGGDVDDPGTYQTLVDASAGQLGDMSYVHFYDDVLGTPIFNSEFAGLLGIVDFTGAPLATINSQTEWVVAFPSTDDNVDFSADEGVFLSSHEDSSEILTPPFDFVSPTLGEDNNTHHEFVAADLLLSGCTTHNVDDTRCGLDARFDRVDMDLGAAQVTAVQENSDVEVTADYTVVGHPENIALTALKTTIQEASGADCSLADVSDEIGLPDVTLLIAKITDNDKTALTGLWVLWTAADDNDVGGASNQLKLAVPADVSIHSAAGDAAVNLACGDATGAGEVHAGVWMPQDLVIELIPGVEETTVSLGGPFLGEMDFDDAHPTDVVDITVIGAPATFSLAASPASIVCNGTNSATVSVTVLNSAGKPVVAGVPVTFEVVALGTANPINTVTDANGVAKSTITPIGNVTAGVTVIVTVNDLGAQSVVVGCQAQALPTQAPPPVIVSPNTGDGGYLP